MLSDIYIYTLGISVSLLILLFYTTQFGTSVNLHVHIKWMFGIANNLFCLQNIPYNCSECEYYTCYNEGCDVQVLSACWYRK